MTDNEWWAKNVAPLDRPVAQVREERQTITAEDIVQIVERENRSCRRQIAVLEEALRIARDWLWAAGAYSLAATALLLGFFLRGC